MSLGLSFIACNESIPVESQALQVERCNEYLQNQLIFQELADKAVENAKVGEKTFDELNSEFGAVRRAIQEKQGKPIQQGETDHFGTIRTGGVVTPMTHKSGPYQRGFDRIAAQMEIVDEAAEGAESYGLRAFAGGPGVDTKHYAFLKPDPTDSKNMLVLTRFERISPTHVQMVHTVPEYLEKVMDIVRAKYKIALESDKSVADIMKAIGEFHWWYAQATPFLRGSASIGEMHAASLLKYHKIKGLTLYNYLGFFKRHRIHLDVWALTTGDPLEFAQNYELALRFKYGIPTRFPSLAASGAK
jgi:hypothetical protein